MRLHRFYTTENVGNKTEITMNSPELVNQVSRVFRLKKGDKVIIFDGSGSDYGCEIIGLEKTSVVLRVAESLPSRYMPERDIYLYQAMVKKDNFEWIVEKATELGVTHIIPVMAEHSEKKSLNEERLRKIAIEASEQSGRGNVPVIHPILSLEQAVLERVKGSTRSDLVFHTVGNLMVNSPTRSDLVNVFIGPEGGWSAKELEMFHANNMDIVCLGPQVLRSETAVIAALSQVVS